ncbi:hypothetical protein K443DRAFT_672034 [Laccaria amethystina LaAM-08-1]|uniref:Uncharacterized protein n=1 Tax=Laccaria amethystina LaAM-08-1 TaxID=1095629 RepID=A0A0C9Y505_9AGAR|nr:hypothetical protein K443DRAFT_672034 [Laccaria amethystina LaAM-08-1]
MANSCYCDIDDVDLIANGIVELGGEIRDSVVSRQMKARHLKYMRSAFIGAWTRLYLGN